MTSRAPIKPCPECVKYSGRTDMYVKILGRGRSRLVVIWACPICMYTEGNLL